MTEMLPFNTSPLPVRLRIEDYLLLDSSGAFAPYNRTELIDGGVYFVNAQHRPHALAKMELYDAFRDGLRAIGSPLRPLVEASVALSDYDVPEPDIVLTDEPTGEGLIPLASVALVVEVSDATLLKETKRKATIYARASVPEYWIADINARVIHQMSAPTGPTYAHKRTVSFGDTIEATKISGLTVDTASI